MVGDFERLAQEFIRPEAVLHYRICGERDARGRPRLRSRVTGHVEVVCQRCLQPLALTVESDRLLYLAQSEEEAERLEIVLADETLEVVVAGRSLDLAGLVEDEVLLSLPLVPMHDVCGHVYAADDTGSADAAE